MLNNYHLKRSRKIVRQFKKGQLTIKYNLDSVPINTSINWDYIHGKNKSTYQVYLHSLNFIQDFIYVANHDKKPSLHKLAKEIVLDWYKNTRTNKKNGAWHEHSVSARIINIIDFQLSAEDHKIDSETFQKIIKQHCGYLYLDSKYKYNNHGLMMDNALIYASRFIENETLKNRYISKALLRVKLSLRRDVSSNFLHTENSPEYHKLYLAIMDDILETCKLLNINLGAEYESIIHNAKVISNVIVKPNMEFPMLGDTGRISLKSEKIYEDFVDNDAGLAIFQNKNLKKDSNSTFFTFTCGYKSKTHKHNDDLSVTYFLNGHDLLVDSGKYGYDRKDVIRNYIISPDAHSTIYLKNSEYLLPSNSFSVRDRLKITKSLITKSFKIITGINNLYDGVKIKRSCIITSDNVLIVIDNITSEENQTVIQNFNLSPFSKVSRLSDDSFSINVDKTKYHLKTLLINGDQLTSYLTEGNVSLKFGEITKNNKAVFEVNGNNICVVSTLAEKKQQVDIIEYDEDYIVFEVNKKRYDIPFEL